MRDLVIVVVRRTSYSPRAVKFLLPAGSNVLVANSTYTGAPEMRFLVEQESEAPVSETWEFLEVVMSMSGESLVRENIGQGWRTIPLTDTYAASRGVLLVRKVGPE